MSEESLPSEAPNEQPSPNPRRSTAAQPPLNLPSRQTKAQSKKLIMPTVSKLSQVRATRSSARPLNAMCVGQKKPLLKKKASRRLRKISAKKTVRRRQASTNSKPSQPTGRERERERGRGRGRQGKAQADEPKVKLDDKKVAKRAWKIFLGEVGEEGLALIADKDAREMARRSLRVAEIYSREEAALYKKAK